jgi:hypothetical protein
MTIGASIFLIALGAILKYAVDVTVSGIEIQTIGLFLLTQADRRRGTVVYDDRDPVVR